MKLHQSLPSVLKDISLSSQRTNKKKFWISAAFSSYCCCCCCCCCFWLPFCSSLLLRRAVIPIAPITSATAKNPFHCYSFSTTRTTSIMSSSPLRRRSPRFQCRAAGTVVSKKITSTTACATITTIAPIACYTTTTSAARTTALAASSSNNNDNENEYESRQSNKRIKVEKASEMTTDIVDDPPTAVSPSPPPAKKTVNNNKKRKTTVEESSTSTKITVKQVASTKKKKTVTTSTKQKKRSSSSSPSRPLPGSKEPPTDWEDIYDLVVELRMDKTAPVDYAGAEALPETCHGDVVFRFQVLVALMLSSQTKDAVVADAMKQLQQHGLTINNIAYNTSHEKLNALISKVGFHNNKTKYIKQVADILLQEYDGDIPKTAQEMIEKLPGVGPKMAYIIETIAWNTTSGIGIDTHMHRMFNQLGWVTDTKNPELTRIELEAWLPRSKWSEINYVFVGFGQEVQQYKSKILRKALNCTRPVDALKLLKRVGLDPIKEGKKIGIEDEVRQVMRTK